MLPAIGAAALALDAIQSLTSSASASTQSQSSDLGLSFSDAINASAAQGSSTAASSVSGGSQISPGNFSALLDAQGRSSVGSTGFDGSADASPSDSSTLSATASSTYNAVDQSLLSQSGTIPLGVNPFSVSV